jgi:hypothetical protein
MIEDHRLESEAVPQLATPDASAHTALTRRSAWDVQVAHTQSALSL